MEEELSNYYISRGMVFVDNLYGYKNTTELYKLTILLYSSPYKIPNKCFLVYRNSGLWIVRDEELNEYSVYIYEGNEWENEKTKSITHILNKFDKKNNK